MAERSGKHSLRVGNLDTRRAIMDQRDLVNALMLLASRGQAGAVYNISSEHIYQMRDIVAMIEQSIGFKFEINVDPKLIRPTDERIIVGNITKLKQVTGWSQKIPMAQTVSDMLNYWRNIL